MAGVAEDVFPDQLNFSQAEEAVTGIALLHFVEGEKTSADQPVDRGTKFGFRRGSAHGVAKDMNTTASAAVKLRFFTTENGLITRKTL